MLVFSGPTGEGVCLWDSPKVLALTGSNGETWPATSDDAIGAPGVGFDRVGGSSVLTYADGHAGAHVTGVTLDLANGVRCRGHGAERLLCGLVALPVRRHRSRGHLLRGTLDIKTSATSVRANPSSSGIQP